MSIVSSLVIVYGICQTIESSSELSRMFESIKAFLEEKSSKNGFSTLVLEISTKISFHFNQ